MAVAKTSVEYNKVRFINNRFSEASAANTALTSTTTSDELPQRLMMVVVKYSAAPTQAGVTVDLDSGVGAAYDGTLNTGTANAQSTVYIPSNDLIVHAGDAISVTAPAGGVGITSQISIYTESIRS